MTPDRIASIPAFGRSFDLETHRVQPGLVAPPPVCGSVAWWDGSAIQGALLDAEKSFQAWWSFVNDPRVVLVGQNLPFDNLVMVVYAARHHGIDAFPAVFAAYREGRVFGIDTVQKLDAIAKGCLFIDPRTGGKLRDPESGEVGVGYRQSVIADLVCGIRNAKANARFRESYALLEGIPIAEWPLDAQTYPVDDTKIALQVALAQIGFLPRVGAHRWAPGPLCVQCGSTDTKDKRCTYVEPAENLHEASRQLFAAWCLHLGAAWGFKVDPDEVAKLEKTTWLIDPNTGVPTPRWHARQKFVEAKIIRGEDVPKSKKPGSEDQSVLKRMVATAYGAKDPCSACAGTGKVPSPKTEGRTKINCEACNGTALDLSKVEALTEDGPDEEEIAVPRTDKGGVGKGRDVLFESGNPLLMDYAVFKLDQKIESTYLPWLRKGLHAPLTLRPNELLETGRTSYGDVVQLCPREGGVRECVVARPGHVLSSSDWEGAELIGHGQSCIWIVGYSVLAEQLVNKVKPHNAFAARVLGISYAEFNARYDAKDKQAEDTRQAAKPANFGFPGRMGAWKLVLQQRKQGPDTPHPEGPSVLKNGQRGYRGLRFCILMGEAKRCGERMITEYKQRTGPPTCVACIRAAERLRADWLSTYTENNAYFRHVKQIDESDERVVQHVYRRIRGGATGNAIANGYFQGLIADAIKDALIAIATDCYTAPSSPLYGSRVILVAHDETIMEHRRELAHAAAMAGAGHMSTALKRACPDLASAVAVDPALMERWLKGAKTVYGANGELAVWRPKK